MWRNLKNSKKPIRRLDFRLDPCPGCKEEERGFFSSMEGEERAEGGEEAPKNEKYNYLSTKNWKWNSPGAEFENTDNYFSDLTEGRGGR